MKKITAIFLTALLLMQAGAAFAATGRDLQGMDIDIGTGLQMEMDSLVSEVLQQEVKVYVYTAAFDGEYAAVYGDVYTADGPDELGAYLHHCKLTLKYEPENEFGFSVVSCDHLSPEYRAGDVMQWGMVDNEVYGYSFSLPTGFEEVDPSTQHMVWQAAEGETLTVLSYENPGYLSALEAYLNDPTGEVLVQNEDFGHFYTYGEDFFELYVVVEGMEYAYTVRMEFPAERQGEYLLYGEMIRNSFMVWGGAVG